MRVLLTVAITVASAGTCWTQTKPAFDLPEKWTRTSRPFPGKNVPPGINRTIDVGLAPVQTGERFRTNVTLITEKSDQKIDAYVKTNLANLKLQVPGAKLVSNVKFNPRSGLPARKLIFDIAFKGVTVRQVMYFFDGGKTKFVLNGTTAPATAKRDQPVFETIALSFRITKAK